MVLLVSAACQAEPNDDLSVLLEKISSEMSIKNQKRDDLDLQTNAAYMTKFGHEIEPFFDSDAINIVVHLKSRIGNLDCSDVALNDLETLHIIFKNFKYLDDMCLSEFDLERNIDFLSLYSSDDSLVALLEKYDSMKGILPISERELYDMAFIYCGKQVLNFLEQRDVTEGVVFDQADFELRESSELHSCI